MPKEQDPFRKYVKDLEKRKWRCTFCNKEFAGSTPRIRAHLAGIPGYGIKPCEKVEDPVRAEALETFNGKGSRLDKSMGGTSGEGTKRIVIGASQSVLPSDDTSDPNDTQNSKQPGCVPQQPSCYWPIGTGAASACPQDQVSLPPGDMSLDNLDTSQQPDILNHCLGAAHGNENASSLQQLLMDSSASLSLDFAELAALPEQPTLLEPETEQQNSRGLSSLPNDQVLGNLHGGYVIPTPLLSNINMTSIPQYSSEQNPSFEELFPDSFLDSPLLWTENLHSSLPENHLESRDVDVNTYEEIQMNELHIPTVGSSLQIDSSLDVDSANRLQDCGQPCEVEVVPVRSNTSPTNTVPENRLESCDVDVNTYEEIQTNGLHNPTVGSSLQIDSSLDVDRANGLQDCVQPRVVEGVPAHSNTSLTDTVQHACQLPQRCDKEDGNDICRFPSQTPMVIDPSTALQHPTDSHIFEATNVHLLAPGTSTNPIGPSSSHGLVPPQRQIVPHRSINLQTAHQNPTVPSSSWENRLVTGHPQALVDMDPCMPSSSQSPNHAPRPPQILPCGTGLIGPSSLPELDMNEGAPMTSHPNTYNIFEESGALKRKLELFSKEAHIREELEFGASLSLKKPRMEVANWLVDVEKLRNDCPLPHQVDILMCEAEDLGRQGEGLFETRETKVNNLIEEKMVGKAFQRNTTKILQHLEGNEISQLGICGMGGVGKTTIMVHIHNRLKKANYGNVIWITVSQDFKIQTLQDTIAEEIDLDMLNENDVRKRAAMLCDRLMKRGKSTIILDDVWDYFDLNEVGIPVRANGIKLVLTTRSFEVCRQMQCQEVIKIEPLSHIEAESLFLKELGFKETLNLETKAIVKSIVDECAGLPLAVITMARSMRGVTDVYEWKDCLKKLRDSDMEQTDMEKMVLKKLEFSYNRLGKSEVQQCFLSCALYREDKLIVKSELIEFFIDQGLFGQLDTREEKYFRGLTILNKLANVCLLEDHGRAMKMHDLIRDMALHIMSATSIVKVGKGLKRIPSEEYWTDALEKVSLMENNIEEFPLNMSPNCPKLSTLLFNKSLLHDVIIPDSFFKQLWGLKVLNLSGCRLRELPDSLSDLVNLTALLLRECNELHRIPHLGKLRSLRKLDISFCVRVEALEGLEMLVNLRYLDMIATRIERLPKGTLGALLSLQYLGVRQVNGEEIAKLWALKTLICCFDNVHDFNKLVRVVSKRESNPCYYRITVHQKDLGVVKPTGFGVLLRNCERSVNILRSIVNAKGESNGRGSGICILIPQDVQNLKAWCCDGAMNLYDMGPLEKLEELHIRFWSNLRVLCGGQDEEVIDIHDSPTRTPTPLLLRSLKDLEISYCPRLKYLIGHEPKFSLPHLQRIRISHCEEMVGITVAATSPPPYPPPAFPSLKEIIVDNCNKIKRVVESEWLPHLPNLRRIKVQYCNDMEEIIGGLSSYMSDEEISPERLLVEGWHELPPHLQNLQTIQVTGCEGMAELISGAGQGREESMTIPVNNTPSSSQSSISLLELNSLYLHSLPQLKSLCEVPITCNSMKNLVVIGCPELNRIPVELQLRDIEDLPYIEVEGEEKWKTLKWDHPDAQTNLQPHLVFKGSRCILEGRRNSPFAIVGDDPIVTAVTAAFNDAFAAAAFAFRIAVADPDAAAVAEPVVAAVAALNAAAVDANTAAAAVDTAAADAADAAADAVPADAAATAATLAAANVAALTTFAAYAAAFAAFAAAFANFATAIAADFAVAATTFDMATATFAAKAKALADAATAAALVNAFAADAVDTFDNAIYAFANAVGTFADAVGAFADTDDDAAFADTDDDAAFADTDDASANNAVAAVVFAFCEKGGDRILSLKAIAL